MMNHRPGIVTLYAMFVGFVCNYISYTGMFEEVILYAKANQTNLEALALFR